MPDTQLEIGRMKDLGRGGRAGNHLLLPTFRKNPSTKSFPRFEFVFKRRSFLIWFLQSQMSLGEEKQIMAVARVFERRL